MVGAMRDSLALNVGRDCDVDIDVRGHWLYVRLCEMPDIEGEDGEVILHLHQETKNYCQWAEVRAKGDKVGKPRDWPDEKLEFYKIAKCLSDICKVGDIVLCPEDHAWGIKGSLYADDENFVDEAVVIARYREVENA